MVISLYRFNTIISLWDRPVYYLCIHLVLLFMSPCFFLCDDKCCSNDFVYI